MTEAVHVNFARPIPLFPLTETVLFPHTLQPLHVFEPRYRQMISHCLDGPGQLAMATYQRDPGQRAEDDATIPLRSVACVGQIVQHRALEDGRFNVLLLGICRVRIVEINEPQSDILYRTGMLRPFTEPDAEPTLSGSRRRLRDLLTSPQLHHMRGVSRVLEWFDRDDVPTSALLELIGYTLLDDPELKYQLLAEGDPDNRVRIVLRELLHLDRLVRIASRQAPQDWPKGMSWN